MRHWFVSAAALSCAMALAVPASAHHAANAQFDVTKSVDMQGKLSRFLDANPHAYWYFNVTGPDGKTEEWSIESAAPNAWRRAGLRLKDDVKVGQTYNFKIAPGLLPGKPIGLMRAVEVNGKWITLMGTN